MAVDHMRLIQLMLHDQFTARTYASTRTRRLSPSKSGGRHRPIDYVDHNRCLQGRVGRPPRRLGGLRALVSEPGLSDTSIGSSSKRSG